MPPRVRVHDRHVISRHRVFDVEEARHERADGSVKTMTTLACPDWANVVAVTSDQKLVLVRQFRAGPEEETLETPGGEVDPGEEPVEAARRELFEETGYAADALEPLGWAHPNPALSANRIHFFLAYPARFVAPPAFDGDGEECEVVLVDLTEIDRLVENGLFSHALCWAALYAARRSLSGRR